MSKNLLCFVVVLSFVGAAFAGQNFTDNASDHSACDPLNWAQGIVPADSTTPPGEVDPPFHTEVIMGTDGSICVIGDGCTVECYGWRQAAEQGKKNTTQILGSGHLVIGSWGFQMPRGGNSADDDGTHGKFFVTGGTIDSPNLDIPVGWTHSSEPEVTGDMVVQDGVLNVGWLNMSPQTYKHSSIKLLGGVINVSQWMEIDNDTASIEVGGGQLIYNGDRTGTGGQDLQPHIDAGLITSAPGYTLSLDYDVTNPGKTTLAAVSDLTPSPADNSQVPSSTSTLTFTVPAPVGGGTVACDVYFGESTLKEWSSLNDPNAEADYIAAGGVEGDWLPDVSGLPLLEAGNTTGSVALPPLADDVNYSWKVDVIETQAGEPNLVASYLFNFDSVGNFAPVVDAGNNLYSFLDGGSRTVTLNGVFIEDDSNPIPAVPTWSVVSANTPFEDGPQSPISAATYGFAGSADQLDAQFNMTVAGDYTLQLDADDTDLQAVPDTMIIFVRDTACQATQIFPNYGNDEEPGLFMPLVGDINDDCVVDLNDMSALASDWLDSDVMDDTTEYIPE